MTVNEAIAEIIKGERTAAAVMALQALRKQDPRPIRKSYSGTKHMRVCTCPSCGWLVGTRDHRISKEFYCKHCGQKIIDIGDN